MGLRVVTRPAWSPPRPLALPAPVQGAALVAERLVIATTEELWFDEWQHGGLPWEKRDSYEKFSPHRFAKNFKTPMLIIHNDLDFRVPVAEGLQLFTTLQRLGVPSKMINFPDEGHWVLKPANSAYWHREVFAWLKKYAPPGGR